MKNALVILAGGKGRRFGQKIPKQFYKKDGKAIINIFLSSVEIDLFKFTVISLDKKYIDIIKNSSFYNNYKGKLFFSTPGKTRQQSSCNALKKISKFGIDNVLIHDAARPNFTHRLLSNLIKALKNNKAVIPAVNPKDSIKYKVKDQLFNLNRNNSFLTQTPQAYKFKNLYNLAIMQKNKITDEASLFIENNHKIKFIKGENLNYKITFNEDLKNRNTYFGIGFDIHRLIKGKKLFLGGIKIPFHSGLEGHSDGDVIIHSVIDSLLGAMRKKDIGSFFPDNKKKYKNIRSPKMLKSIVRILNNNNFYINNLDINLICEQPKVSKYRDKIIKSLSNLLSIDKDLINLKGKTVEKLGLIGREKAIACEVICSISR